MIERRELLVLLLAFVSVAAAIPITSTASSSASSHGDVLDNVRNVEGSEVNPLPCREKRIIGISE